MNNYYRHFKGGIYRFVGIARHSETQEEMVVYQNVSEAGQIWVRPKAMFYEEIERDGKRIPRFQELSEQEALPFELGVNPETWKNEPPF